MINGSIPLHACKYLATLLIVALCVPVMAQETQLNAPSGRSQPSRRSRSSDQQERATTDRNNTRERNSRRSSRNDKKEEAKPDAAKAGTKKIEGAKPAAKSAKSSGGSARGTTNVEFKMTVNERTNVLFVEGLANGQPTLSMEVPMDKEFVTRVALSNPRRSSFKTAVFALKYDPALLRPVAIDDVTVADLLEEPLSARVDTRRGIIFYDAIFKDQREDETLNLARIIWEPLAPTAHSRLILLNNASVRSGVFSIGGQNILHFRDDGQAEASEQAGLLAASVSINPAGRTAEELETDDSFSAIAMTNGISQGTLEGGVSLALRPRVTAVRAGETFLVDVLYENPKRAEIDTVQLMIGFDPRMLQVEDFDNDNWITRGTNILDGPYRDDLPFDFHRKNTALNSTGEIYYDMGFSSKVFIPARGIIATIKFRALEGGSTAAIVFDAKETTSQPTRISFLGFDLIGEKNRKQAYLQNAAVSIR